MLSTIGASTTVAFAANKQDTKNILAETVKPKIVTSASLPAVPQPKHYTVVSGDNLSEIADANSLISWRDLWNSNESISDPNLIYAGQDFVIPTDATVERPLPVTVNPAPLDEASNAYNAQRPALSRAVVTNPNASTGDIFAHIRQRESGGNYATNTGNGYYGAYQYDIGTWGNYHGYARADLAPPAVQDEKAAETYSRRGCSPWPNTCY